MTPPYRKLLSFVLLFVPLFILCFVLYVWMVPAYEPLVMGTANAIMLQMTPPTHLESIVEGKGGWEAFVWSADEGERRIRGWGPATAHLAYLSIVTLPALLLATPAPIRSRFLLLAIAIPLLFISHVTSLIVTTRGVHCLWKEPGTFYCLWALRMAYTSGQIFAATFWILGTWRYWFPGFGRPATRKRSGDNA
jgi:hypothetical protein